MIRNLYFIELTVADWEASITWYRDKLGLELVLRMDSNQFALLRAGAGRLALKAGAPQVGTVLLAFEVDDLPSELERLHDLGIVPEKSLIESSEGYRQAIVRDPDGYRLSLFDWPGLPP